MDYITDIKNKINILVENNKELLKKVNFLESEYEYKVSIRLHSLRVGTQDYIDYHKALDNIEHEIELLFVEIKKNRQEIGEFDLEISRYLLEKNKNVDYLDTTKRNCMIIDGKFCYYDKLTEIPREKLTKEVSADFYFCDTLAGKHYEAYYSNGKTIYCRTISFIHDCENGDVVVTKSSPSVNIITLYFVKNNPKYRIEINLLNNKKYLRGFKDYWSSLELSSFNEEQIELIKKAIKIMGNEACYKEEVELLNGLL